MGNECFYALSCLCSLLLQPRLPGPPGTCAKGCRQLTGTPLLYLQHCYAHPFIDQSLDDMETVSLVSLMVFLGTGE